jgi:hypothetical protein
MRILINNLLEDADFTVNNPSEAFPIANIYNDSPTERVQFDSTIVIDLGSAESITAIAYLNTTDAITIEANSSDSWGAPAFSQTLTSEVTFVSQTYRYWRINTGQTASRLGYFYLGSYINVSDTDGTHELITNKTDIKNPTSMSSIFPTRGINYITEEYFFPIMDFAERGIFSTWWDSSDSVKNHFIVPFEDNLTDYPPYFGTVLEPEYTREFNVWQLKFSTREAK